MAIFIIILVCFTMVMFIWLLYLLGGVSLGGQPAQPAGAGGWLPWFACFFLGVVVFLIGSGVIVIQKWG